MFRDVNCITCTASDEDDFWLVRTIRICALRLRNWSVLIDICNAIDHLCKLLAGNLVEASHRMLVLCVWKENLLNLSYDFRLVRISYR